MKTLKTVIKIIGGILLFFIIILSILGYYLTRMIFQILLNIMYLSENEFIQQHRQ